MKILIATIGSRGDVQPYLNLAQAIAQALSDSTMRAKADQVGAAIRAEPDGVEAAVRLIGTV